MTTQTVRVDHPRTDAQRNCVGADTYPAPADHGRSDAHAPIVGGGGPNIRGGHVVGDIHPGPAAAVQSPHPATPVATPAAPAPGGDPTAPTPARAGSTPIGVAPGSVPPDSPSATAKRRTDTQGGVAVADGPQRSAP